LLKESFGIFAAMNNKAQSLYATYVQKMHTVADIRYASALLQWDQETYLPPKGAPIRGQQIATLSELAHRHFTEDSLGDLLKELLQTEGLTPDEKRNAQLTQEDYERQKKLPSAFVRTLSETVNKSFHSWIEARKKNDFTLFAGDLGKLAELKKQEADLLGYEAHPYNALLNDHDKGATVQLVDKVFNSVRQPLKDLLEKIRNAKQVDDRFLHQHFPKDKQWAFGMQLLKDLGYDFEAGRQDISEHPFSISFNSQDVRITTRIDENNLANMTWSCIHELGHAFYEQNLPMEQYGLPLGEAASYTIHESQSRLWENHVGRSLVFCERFFPLIKQFFPEQLANIPTDKFYRGINKVEPSLIRTEADELTYHFHIMIRYELEKLLIEGNLPVSDIPAYWNEQYSKYLGVTVPNDTKGCLQDVHWSHGSFGYFPTYSLGSFYAAQFYHSANQSITDLMGQIQKGETSALLNWLSKRVHRFGRKYISEDLSKEVSGEPLNIEYFIQYVADKYKYIYEF
jgi:carboxypeptidase Taq